MDESFKNHLCLVAQLLIMIAITVAVIWSLGGFCIASAETLIADGRFTESGPGSDTYNCSYASTVPSCVNKSLYGFYVDTPSECGDVTQLSLTYGVDYVWRNPAVYGPNEFLVTTINNRDGHAVVGNGTIMYTYSANNDVVYLRLVIDDLNWSALSPNSILYFDPIWSSTDLLFIAPKINSAGNGIFDYLEDDELAFCTNPSYGGHPYLGYNSDDALGDPDHSYNVWSYTRFRNRYEIYDTGSCYVPYRFVIWRENIPDWEYSVKSKWTVYDADYSYSAETVFSETNKSLYMFPSACDWLVLNCTEYIGKQKTWHLNLTDICDVPEPGYFNLSGHTRSIEGPLVPAVTVDVVGEGNIAMSGEIGWYCFGDDCLDCYFYIPELNETNFGDKIETGSFTLKTVKSGFYNTTESMYYGIPGSYQHDIYMIPIDALDTGEFGGVVYDYCTLKPIQGAYVYLFNETADSGKYAYSNQYGFYRFVNMTEGLDYEVSASKEDYEASIIHGFTFNESNINETHCKLKDIWLLPEGGCPDEPTPTAPPPPTSTPPPIHEYTNEEIITQLRQIVPPLFFIVLLLSFLWFVRRAGGSRR